MKWAVGLIITAKCVCHSGDWWLAVCYLVSKIYFLYSVNVMTILHTLVKTIQSAGIVFLLWILSLLEF